MQEINQWNLLVTSCYFVSKSNNLPFESRLGNESLLVICRTEMYRTVNGRLKSLKTLKTLQES